MAKEWGPWIDHDGKGCPCVGQFCEAVYRDGRSTTCVAGEECRRRGRDPNGPLSAWMWRTGRSIYTDVDGSLFYRDPGDDIIRYRIRKPRGLTILQEIAADPQPIKESERVE